MGVRRGGAEGGALRPPRVRAGLATEQSEAGRNPEVQGTNCSRQKGVRQALEKERAGALSPGQK